MAAHQERQNRELFGQFIRQMRVKRTDLTQAEAAKSIGVTRGRYRAIENGAVWPSAAESTRLTADFKLPEGVLETLTEMLRQRPGSISARELELTMAHLEGGTSADELVAEGEDDDQALSGSTWLERIVSLAGVDYLILNMTCSILVIVAVLWASPTAGLDALAPRIPDAMEPFVVGAALLVSSFLLGDVLAPVLSRLRRFGKLSDIYTAYEDELLRSGIMFQRGWRKYSHVKRFIAPARRGYVRQHCLKAELVEWLTVLTAGVGVSYLVFGLFYTRLLVTGAICLAATPMLYSFCLTRVRRAVIAIYDAIDEARFH
jgi:DNA-binding XRE family transcriptional regulator